MSVTGLTAATTSFRVELEAVRCVGALLLCILEEGIHTNIYKRRKVIDCQIEACMNMFCE